MSVAWATGVQLLVFFCSSVSVGCSTPQGSPGVGRNTFLSSPHLCFIIVFICDLFVSRDDSLMSQLIRFARVSSHVADFNPHNKSLTAKLFQQGYRYHKLRKTFSKFYRRHYELVSKFSVGLKALSHQGLSAPEFYGDSVYKFKKIEGRADFSDQLEK